MEVSNAVLPNEEQVKGFFESSQEEQIYMVNLLKFREQAHYEDGRRSTLSGKDAYQLYAEEVSRLITEVGGYMAFVGDIGRLMLGEVEDLWDVTAIAVYPSRTAMLEMIQMPEYSKISVHRSAGLAGQLNIEVVNASGQWLE